MAYFKLPLFTELTRDQRLALEEASPISLSGGPGTGKTVVSLWRHIRNHKLNGVRSLLLTYTKTLEFYLKQVSKVENVEASKYISRTYKWTCGRKEHYDEIIIDEAQDVEIDKYRIIKKYTDTVSYGADDAQSLYEGTCSTDDLINLFPDNEEHELSKNFRNSKEILLFTQSVFPSISIDRNVIDNAVESGNKPILNEIGWNDFEDSAMEEIIGIINDYPDESHNIGVLVPSINMVEDFYSRLSRRVNCSKYHNEMDDFVNFERVHITTFKSAKGLEFDTVIIPKFDSYNWFINNTDRFSESDYYVALTRAKLNLYLLCKNDINIGTSSTYDKE